jgi:hypothetical protein
MVLVLSDVEYRQGTERAGRFHVLEVIFRGVVFRGIVQGNRQVAEREGDSPQDQSDFHPDIVYHAVSFGQASRSVLAGLLFHVFAAASVG